jgi:amidase
MYKLVLMTGTEEKLLSRRAFVKTALAGAVAASFVRIGQATGQAHVLPRVGHTPGELTKLTLSEASELVRSRKVSPVELTQACLSRIEQLNPKLNAFITVMADSALAQAREAESDIQRGRWKGPLHGVPIALKDLVDTVGVRTTAASGLFKDRIPTQDAEIVRRLKASGAVLLGKLNLHEFAYGGSSVISYFGASVIRGTPLIAQAALPAGLPPLLQRSSVTGLLVPILEDPSVCRQPTAASSDSNPHMVASAQGA